MSRERLDRWCEQAVVALVLVILAWGPLAFGGVRPSEFVVLQGLALVVLGLWVARFWLNPGLRLVWPPVAWAALAFAAYAVLRYPFADLEYVARQELIRVLVYAVLFFACLNNLGHRRALRQVVYLLVILATGEAAFALYQFLNHSPRIWNLYKPEVYLQRGSGTYVNPNHLAGFLEMVLPLAIAYAAASRAGLLRRSLVAYGALMVAAGLALSLSRTAWISATLALLWLVVLLVHTLRQWVVLIGFVTFLLGIAPVIYASSVQVRMRVDALRRSLTSARSVERVGYSQAAFRMWQDHPWFGVGPAHYDARYRGYRAEHWVLGGRPGWTHNDYLNTLADWGLVGAGLVAASFGLVGWGLARRWRDLRRASNDPSRRAGELFYFVAGASAGLVAILVHSIADFNMHIPANAILAVILLALLAGLVASDRQVRPVTPFIRWTASLVAGLLLAGLGWQGWKSAREDYWLRKATTLEMLSAARIGALERAFAIEPSNDTTAYLIGEQHRGRSWRGQADSREQAEQAMIWFRRAAALNPFDPLCRVGLGACLDWTGRFDEGEPWFRKALELDPHNYKTRGMMGWHYMQRENWTEALKWFDASWKLNSTDNEFLPYALEARKRLSEQTPVSPNK